jgi:hypothetical protein
MELKAGFRLRSTTGSTEAIVVRAGAGALLGKRDVDAGDTAEVLCTKAGGGPLSIDATPLLVKETKPLPSSD